MNNNAIQQDYLLCVSKAVKGVSAFAVARKFLLQWFLLRWFLLRWFLFLVCLTGAPSLFAMSLSVDETHLQQLIDTQLPAKFGDKAISAVITKARISLLEPNYLYLTVESDIVAPAGPFTVDVLIRSELNYDNQQQQIHIAKPVVERIKQKKGDAGLLKQYKSQISSVLHQEIPVIFLLDLEKLGLPANVISGVTVQDKSLTLHF